MKIKKIKNKGISLIELIIYISILSLMMVAIVSFVSVLQKSKNSNRAVSEVEMQGTQMVNLISQKIRNAESVSIPASGLSGSGLSLGNYVESKNPTLFDLSGGKLRIKEGLGNYVELNSDKVLVEDLVFKNLGDGTLSSVVAFELTVSYSNPGSKDELNYGKIFYGTGTLR